MRFHGASKRPTGNGGRSKPKVRPPRAEDDFRNLFGPAKPDDQFQGFGPGKEDRTHLMLQRLARRMLAEEVQRDHNAENTNIPAGYTYLGQFAAHDLVHNTTPLSFTGEVSDLRRNRRSERLILDTLYGGGPAVLPIAYALPPGGVAQRTQLRVGRIREGAPGPLRCAERDIPRAACPHLNDDPGRGSPDVLLPDARNDDNLILSQLTALFHILHNHLDVVLAAAENAPQDDYRRFLAVRRVMALVYRNILVKDLLQRLLNRRVYEHYNSANPRFLDSSGDVRMPLEFSHAAYRIGHSMVRSVYRINQTRQFVALKDILRTTSASRPFDMPLTRDWLLQWRFFFELGDEAPDLSRRLEPSIAPTLATSEIFGRDTDEFGALLYRDLVRGSVSGLRSLDSIIREIKRGLPGKALASAPLLSDADERSARLRNWLTAKGGGSSAGNAGFDADDLDKLCQDPPLQFFILFEAAQSENGERLGLLGSTILAEVFFASLAETRALIEDDPETRALAGSHFSSGIPETMPQLIRYLANATGLANAESLFI